MTTPRREERSEQILSTAARLFSERGFHVTRMSDIAGELGMKAGSLYYHFASKEAVLVALIENRIGAAVTMLEVIVDQETDVLDQIGAGITGHLRVFAADPDLYSIFLNERLDHIVPEAAAEVDRLGRRYEELWRNLLARGIADGALRPGLDPWLAMKAVVGMCNSILFWYRPGGRMTPEAIAEQFATTVLDGLRR